MPYKDPEKTKACKARYRDRNRDKLKKDSQKHYANNRERWYDYELQSNYGVTLEEYKLLLNGQGNVCAICGGVNANGWRLCLDHDHTTNKPRGLLCRKCNTLLGLCNDREDVLFSAITYLERFKL